MNTLLTVRYRSVVSVVILFALNWTAAAQPPATEPPNTKGNANQEEGAVIETHQAVKATAGPPTFVLPDHQNLQSLRFGADGKSLVCVAYENDGITIRTWDISKKTLAREVKLEWDAKWTHQFRSMILSNDLTKVISILDRQVAIWDAATGKIIKRLDPPEEFREDFLNQLACTPDASLIACSFDSKYVGSALISDVHVVAWDADAQRVVQIIKLKGQMHLRKLSMSADGKFLATAGYGQIWEISTGNLLLDWHNSNPDRKHPDPAISDRVADVVHSVCFSPDGKVLAIGDLLGVKLIDPTTGNLLRRIDAPFRYDDGRFVFSADGRMLARMDANTTLHGKDAVVPIWSTETGQLLTALPTEAHDGSFSDDGKWFAVGFWDRKQAVAVWQISKPAIQP